MSGLWNKDGAHALVFVKSGNLGIEHPAYLMSKNDEEDDNSDGEEMWTIRWASNGVVEDVPSSRVNESLGRRRRSATLSKKKKPGTRSSRRGEAKQYKVKESLMKRKRRSRVLRRERANSSGSVTSSSRRDSVDEPSDPSSLKEAAKELLDMIKESKNELSVSDNDDITTDDPPTTTSTSLQLLLPEPTPTTGHDETKGTKAIDDIDDSLVSVITSLDSTKPNEKSCLSSDSKEEPVIPSPTAATTTSEDQDNFSRSNNETSPNKDHEKPSTVRSNVSDVSPRKSQVVLSHSEPSVCTNSATVEERHIKDDTKCGAEGSTEIRHKKRKKRRNYKLKTNKEALDSATPCTKEKGNAKEQGTKNTSSSEKKQDHPESLISDNKPEKLSKESNSSEQQFPSPSKSPLTAKDNCVTLKSTNRKRLRTQHDLSQVSPRKMKSKKSLCAVDDPSCSDTIKHPQQNLKTSDKKKYQLKDTSTTTETPPDKKNARDAVESQSNPISSTVVKSIKMSQPLTLNPPKSQASNSTEDNTDETSTMKDAIQPTTTQDQHNPTIFPSIPPLTILISPGESISLPNLAKAKQELMPYLDPSTSKTIFLPKIKSFIDDIINNHSITSLELMLISIQTLKNSNKKILKKLFDVHDPINAGGRGIFLKWLDCVLEVMASKRNTPEATLKMKENLNVQTEERVAVEIMNFIVRFKVIHKMKQLQVMKDNFGVDWFGCVDKTQVFAEEHEISNLIKASSDARAHLEMIKSTSPPSTATSTVVADADYAAGGGLAKAKKNKH